MNQWFYVYLEEGEQWPLECPDPCCYIKSRKSSLRQIAEDAARDHYSRDGSKDRFAIVLYDKSKNLSGVFFIEKSYEVSFSARERLR